MAPHDRLTERHELQTRFRTGASVLMLAPRRVGKTWLQNAVAADLVANGWTCIKIDVEGMVTENEFLRALCHEIDKTQTAKARLLAHLQQRFKQLSTHVQDGNVAAAIGQVDAKEFLETLVASLEESGIDTLILIDEIALFVLSLAERDHHAAHSLLYHLRKLMQAYPKVRWFLTGSVGLDVVARRYGVAGALLGLDPYPLAPFCEAAARSYVDELSATGQVARPFAFEDAAFKHLADELGWLSPYYLRQIALQIIATGGTSADGALRQATIGDVDRAMDKLLSPSQRLHFSAWEEHLVKNFETPTSSRLHAILDTTSEAANGEIETTILARLNDTSAKMTQKELRDLLSILGNDGYLVKDENRWRFRSGLLRRYWREYM